MSTVPHKAPSTDEPPPVILFDHPSADIILRSQDLHHLRVPRIYIVNSSPILCELIQKTFGSSSDANPEASLPVVQLPESGEILHYLLTFIFPVTPLLPSTSEEIMKLLYIAQKYQMDSVLTHIRDRTARHYPLPTCLESSLRIYSLAQKYGFRPEALHTARTIFLNHSMTIEDLENKLDIMPCASLYELLNYHKMVRAHLVSDLAIFRMSRARGTITGLCCTELGQYQIPSWLYLYIKSIGKNPSLFDSAEFNIAMARHIKDKANEPGCECASIPSQTIRNFLEALASVICGSFRKAESALSLMHERKDPQPQVNPVTSPLEPFDVPDANLIIRSSDLVGFRVHKPVLAMASPLFKNLLSLPQPSDSETVDGLPVVQLSESSELLNSLLSILYPIPTVIPNSYEKVLYLLAACQKYDMDSVQSFIRAEVSRGASPVPKGAEAFTAYAIASAKGLIPEMEHAARLTLDHPMTFESLGEGLRLFDGRALNDLVNFRRRCSDNLLTCLELFLKTSGPSRIWIGCPEVMSADPPPKSRVLPKWLKQLLTRNQNDLKLQNFTHPVDVHKRMRGEYLKALQTHLDCKFCLGVHASKGLAFYAELENKLVQARDKVVHSLHLSSTTGLTSAIGIGDSVRPLDGAGIQWSKSHDSFACSMLLVAGVIVSCSALRAFSLAL